MTDPRIENLVRRLLDTNLDSLPAESNERDVGRVLSAGLSEFKHIQRRAGMGIDGSERNPDDARQLPPGERLGLFDVAIEYKLYKNRHDAAGHMDRGLGQCIAYAEQYSAVVFLVVYMASPEHPIPLHWINRATPLYVGHKSPGVPVYFAARPRSWSDPWASRFTR